MAITAIALCEKWSRLFTRRTDGRQIERVQRGRAARLTLAFLRLGCVIPHLVVVRDHAERNEEHLKGDEAESALLAHLLLLEEPIID